MSLTAHALRCMLDFTTRNATVRGVGFNLGVRIPGVQGQTANVGPASIKRGA